MEQLAERGSEAHRLEIVVGDGFHHPAFFAIAEGEMSLGDLIREGREGVDRLSVVPVVEVIDVGEVFDGRCGRRRSDFDEIFRMRSGRRAEQYSVRDSEPDRAQGHSDGERHDGDGREFPIFGEDAERKAEVLREDVEETQSAGVATFFFYGIACAEGQAALSYSFVARD